MKKEKFDYDFSIEFQRYFKSKILDVKKINHRGNNQLYEIWLTEEHYFIKKYSNKHIDNWQRGKSEFKAISYLCDKGFEEIPRPINFYEKENMGVYSFIEGCKINQKDVTKKDIINAVEFLVRLHSLPDEDKRQFSKASSACLSMQDYINVIDKRQRTIKSCTPSGKYRKKIKDLLNKRVYPKIREIKEDFEKKTMSMDTSKELLLENQVLTPADFGFHNILKNENSYSFVDFEYFGRDDPVRQVLDFFHHGASRRIDKKLKNLFIEKYKEKTPHHDLQERIQILDPLINMTWILIDFNFLSKRYIEHLKFSHGENGKEYIESLTKSRLEEVEERLEQMKI